MFEERVLEPGTLSLLHSLEALPELETFFLAEGTALAIQIGHRKSEDLDLFTLDSFDTGSILEALRSAALGKVTVLGEAPNTLNLTVHGVKVDLIRHGYELIENLVSAHRLRLAHPADIAAMKLSAVANRGSRKDFVDLYFLLRQFTLPQMLAFYEKKYPDHDIFPVLKSLAYFEDAEAEPDLVMLENASWGEVKQRIREALQQAG